MADGVGHARWRNRAWLERTTFGLWLILGGAALAALTMGVFWWWIVLIVTIPFVVLAYIAPTAFMYLTVAALPYVLVRLLRPSWAGWRPILGGVALAAAIGVTIPLYANRATRVAVAALTAADVAAPRTLVPRGTVALLDGPGATGPALHPCNDYCQRLLFTGAADAVLVGRPQALTNPAEFVTRHSFVPIASGCRPYLSPARVESVRLGEATGDRDRLLAVRLADFAVADLCLRAERVAGADADVALVNTFSIGQRGEQETDLRLLPVIVSSTMASLQRRGRAWQTVARQSDLNYRLLTVPLTLIPMNGADTGVGTRWGGTTERVQRIRFPLKDWLAFDERVFAADGTPTPAADAAVVRARELADKRH